MSLCRPRRRPIGRGALKKPLPPFTRPCTLHCKVAEGAMNDLERALADIAEIRTQVARGSEFRGYGPVTVAATAVLAIAAGLVQNVWLPKAEAAIGSYLVLWITTAVVCVILIGGEMIARTRRIHSGIADEMLHAATEQFIPASVA